MTKGTYAVTESSPPAKDGSFRSCLCALLVFVAICVILLLAAWPWRTAPRQSHKEDFEEPQKSEKIYDNEKRTQKPDIVEVASTTEMFYTKVENTINITTISVETEMTTSKVRHEIIEINETATETTPKMTTSFEVHTMTTLGQENISKLANTDIPSEKTVITTEMSVDSSSAHVPTSEIWTTLIHQVPTTTEEIFSRTEPNAVATSEPTTVSEITTAQTTTAEPTIQANLTEQILVTNISRTKGTHEALTEDSTEPPQEHETDNYDIFETEDSPLEKKETTVISQVSNAVSTTAKYSNYSNVDQSKLTTTTESNVKRQSRDETDNVTQKETILLHKQHRPVCQDLGCKTTAARMLTRIKHFGDPCDDFYEYACGGYNFDNITQDNWKRIATKLQEIDGNTAPYLKIFQKFHQSCVTYHTHYNYEERVKEAKDILHSVSRLYDRTQKIPEQLTLTEMLTRLLQVGSSLLFDISVDADKQHFVFQMMPGKRNSFLNAENTFQNKQGKCYKDLHKKFLKKSIDLNKSYNEYKKCVANHSDYLNTVERALRVFGELSHLSEFNLTWHMQDIRIAIEWSILNKLDEYTDMSSVKFDIVSRNYTTFKMSELQARYKLINWDNLFSNLTGQTINSDALIHVYFGGYFDELFKEFSTFSTTLHNAILGMFAYELYTTLVLPVQADNYEKFCLKEASRLLPEISSCMYLNSWPSSAITAAQKYLENTFASVKARMVIKIKDAEWLEEITKSAVLEKLDNIGLYSGNTGILSNDTLLNDKYKNVLDGFNATYPQYALAVIKLNNELKYGLWGKQIENNMNDYVWWYYLTPYAKKPVPVYAAHAVVVPLGMILNVPKTVPKYIQMAAILYPVARAIAHHFDPTGIKYTSEWTSNAIKTYGAMENCTLAQYYFAMSQNKYDKELSFIMNRLLSINERIAEDMAIHLVLEMSEDVINDALLPWIGDSYSREETFLLYIAQQHCENLDLRDYMIRLFESEHLPPSLLVRSFFANTKQFAKTFGCAQGSVMSHPLKCPTFFDLTADEDYEQYT